ncbi:hypothetical protein SISNIDRAFT_451388 [Sistotremastrum niveocremeum HHB9708]|uniref:Uncharacterized protein n=1 Tax=Sistotremastrum niveocremeum HHB9708 TaxID=1314777 RepID=A0A164XA71_9AGAM|nr:hypothetical protein SISNIDRAFT_451388 [Sistotremastrum niveocremeum HHB9708]
MLSCTNAMSLTEINRRSQTCAALVSRKTKLFKEKLANPLNVLEESLSNFYGSRLYEASVSCHRTPLKDAA